MAVSNSSPLDYPGQLDSALDRRLERLGLADKPGQWTERYLLCEQLVDPLSASPRQKFEATSRFIRDLIAHRWVMTRRARAKTDPKRIHYLSMEFLPGRALRNNVMNLAADPIAAGDAAARLEPRRIDRGGTGRRPRQRWPRPAGRLFHRFPGDASVPRHRLRPSV